MATLDSQVEMVRDVLDQEVQGESVLLHLGTESYFGLNPLGTLVWQRLRAGMTLRRIHALILDEYAVEPEDLGRDLIDLIDALDDAGLILVLPPSSNGSG
ncbi:MAG TPA: PqqD family protein [Lamprocystis sp. (in: g-proteobacteria)]|nr:PqqD family protein [Lamprocystis sp. (in: g-proteobacteria)]